MTTQANAYQVLAGPQDFLKASFNQTAFYADLVESGFTYPYAHPIQSTVHLAQTLQHSILNTANFEKMDTAECANAYAQQYLSKWGDLLIVGEFYTLFPNVYALGLPTLYPSYAWECPLGNLSNCLLSPWEWKPFGGLALECWAEKITESCTLNFSLTLGLVVIACNVTKVICMAMTIWRHRKPALITIGDAIQSFLDRPDGATSGKCLFSGNQMHLFWKWSQSDCKAKPHQRTMNERRLEMIGRQNYKSEIRSWAAFASLGRWVACLGL